MRFGSFSSSSAAAFSSGLSCTSSSFGFERFSDLFVSQRFELQEHAAQIFSDHFLFHLQFFRRALAEHDPLPVHVHIKRIHMERVAAHCQQIHSQDVAGSDFSRGPGSDSGGRPG